MAPASASLYGKDIISATDVSDRLDYLEFLDDDMFDDERELWAGEIEELAELKALVEAVGTDHGGLVSESYWDTYAADDADELFDLRNTGARQYFDYDAFAEDMQTDYSQVEFHGTNYYYHD